MAEGGTLPTIYPPSKRVKSEVWKYFGFQKNAEGLLIEDGFPLCKTCGRKVAAKHGNTSNMFAHIRDNYPLQFREIKSGHASSSAGSSSAEAIVQPTVQEAFQRQASYGPSSHRAKEINHAIAYCIAKDMIPIYTVAKPGFLKLMKTTVPLKEDVGKRIAQGKWYAATTDLWTSSGGSGHPYISFTIHYLTDWKLQSNCLETQFFPEDHTADNISEFFDNMLQEWGINKEFFKRRRELRNKQEALNIPQRSLIHDVVTRWGSTQKMLQRFIEQQQAVCAVLATEGGAWHLMPKDADIAVIEQVLQILQPLSVFTDALASESRVSLSALWPVLSHIISDILEVKNEDSALTIDLKRVMKSDLESRYSVDAKKVMDLTSFIDPRFKGSFSDDLDATVNCCIEEASKLAEMTTLSQGAAQTEQSSSTPLPFTHTHTSEKQQQSLATLLNKITSTRQQRAEEQEGESSMKSKTEAEIKLYLSLPLIKSEADPLQWWSLHAEELPHLATLAEKFLCIPATSVPSERVFSASGHILSPQRSKLKPEKVNMLTFLHFNLKD
nr:zinc finger BED domain-containing protein 1-like [Danio rerio]|eukprot:XP_017213371.1 zinc finger BED domain-containing protein 1-like [Danio rerio]